jgi:hypothetical protein
MLTREQLHAFLCMKKHPHPIWSAHDKQLIHYMGQASMANFDPYLLSGAGTIFIQL